MKSSRLFRSVRLVAGGGSLVGSVGLALLAETVRATGLDEGLSVELARWMPARAIHDPAKVLLDVAMALVLGGDCLADVGVVRAQPELAGLVASDPTVSRVLDRLAGDVGDALSGIRGARAAARAYAWAHGCPLPATGAVVLDIDASLVTAHSDKQDAKPTYKRGYGFHPLLAFVDHTLAGTGPGGEPLACVLRSGNAGANTAADHITVLGLALEQLPEQVRDRVLVRTDSAGGTKVFLTHLVELGLDYSVGIGTNIGVDAALLAKIPATIWEPALDSNGRPRDGAQVVELTGLLPHLTAKGWPAGMRVIARRERPHPGAQLRTTDIDGWRITTFATNTPSGPGTQLADLELRHRSRARAEDRIRCLKDMGLANLPLHDFTQNQIWCETVLLAADLLAWTQTLGLDEHRRAEPKRLRLRILGAAARVTRSGRRTILHLADRWPWAAEIITAHQRLQALPAP